MSAAFVMIDLLYFFQAIKVRREHVTSGPLLVRQDYMQCLIFCFCFYISFCPFVRVHGQSGLVHLVTDGASAAVIVGLGIPINDPHPPSGIFWRKSASLFPNPVVWFSRESILQIFGDSDLAISPWHWGRQHSCPAVYAWAQGGFHIKREEGLHGRHGYGVMIVMMVGKPPSSMAILLLMCHHQVSLLWAGTSKRPTSHHEKSQSHLC